MYTLIFVLGLCSAAYAHIVYQQSIPNGDSVPDPCSSGIWGPVGHYNAQRHTTAKNPFGLAFAGTVPAHFWTKALCEADSDGDGMTNGEELGDPQCVWYQGQTPARAATGHPGICEPLGSPRCANEVYYCGCKGPSCS